MPVSVDLPEGMREELELRKEEDHYSSMSELIRDALREFLKEENSLNEKEIAALKLLRDGRFKQVELEGKAEEEMEEGLDDLEEARRG